MDTVLAILILIIFVLILPVIIIYIDINDVYKYRVKQKTAEDQNIVYTVKTNGVKISLSKEDINKINVQAAKEDAEYFYNRRSCLLAKIKADKDKTDDIIRQKVLSELLKTRIINLQELEKVDFIYNNGKLRSDEEVARYEQYFAFEKERENFDTERHIVNFIAFTLPFTITLIATTFSVTDRTIGVCLGVILGGFIGLIGMLIGYRINIDNAKTYGIPDNDPRVQEEKLKFKIGVASSVAAGASVFHKTKRAASDLGNVDKWSEMK